MTAPKRKTDGWLYSPYLSLIASVGLMGWAIHEVWDTLFSDLFAGNFRFHHGAILYGVFMTWKSIHELKERTRKLSGTIAEVKSGKTDGDVTLSSLDVGNKSKLEA